MTPPDVLGALVGLSSYEVCRRREAAPGGDTLEGADGAVIVELHRLEARGRARADWLADLSGKWRRRYASGGPTNATLLL